MDNNHAGSIKTTQQMKTIEYKGHILTITEPSQGWYLVSHNKYALGVMASAKGVGRAEELIKLRLDSWCVCTNIVSNDEVYEYTINSTNGIPIHIVAKYNEKQGYTNVSFRTLGFEIPNLTRVHCEYNHIDFESLMCDNQLHVAYTLELIDCALNIDSKESFIKFASNYASDDCYEKILPLAVEVYTNVVKTIS